MKKNIFAIALVAIALCFGACEKQIISGNEENPVNPVNTAKVQQTSDLVNTDWTAVFSLGDFLYAMTGMNLSDYGCQFPEGFDSTMIYHINFDQNFAHITFSDNVTLVNVAEVAGEYTMEEIEQMDLAYVYDVTTHTGTLTAVGTDENGAPINYQLVFTYDDLTDTFTINLQFANAEDEDTTINFPLVFTRDGANA